LSLPLLANLTIMFRVSTIKIRLVPPPTLRLQTRLEAGVSRARFKGNAAIGWSKPWKKYRLPRTVMIRGQFRLRFWQRREVFLSKACFGSGQTTLKVVRHLWHLTQVKLRTLFGTSLRILRLFWHDWDQDERECDGSRNCRIMPDDCDDYYP
jgi:hypothetical protein